MDSFIAAFIGPVLAFLTALYYFQLTKRFDRWNEHRNSLASIELLMNEYLATINDNRAHIVKMRTIAGSKDGKARVFWGSFTSLPLDKSILENTLNIKVKNDVFSLFEKVRKMNHDLELLANSYGRILQLFQENKSNRNQYEISSREVLEGVELISRGFNMLEDKIYGLLALVRAQMTVDPPMPIWKFCRKRNSGTPSDEQISRELESISREIRQVQKQSRIDIDRYLGGNESDK